MKQLVVILVLCATSLLAIFMVVQSQKQSSVAEIIEARRSVRAYEPKKVEREKLQRLAELGVAAPSAMNRQEWELRIVDDEAWIEGATKSYLAAVDGSGKADYMLKDPNFRNIFRNASAVIFIGAPEGEFSDVNIGMLGENIMLAAVDMGLGTCCLGSVLGIFAEPAMKEYLASLGFSEGYRLRYALAVGYPAEQPEAKPRDLSKIAFVE